MSDSTNSLEEQTRAKIALDEFAPQLEAGERRAVEAVVPRLPQLKNGRVRGSRNMTTLLRQAVLNKQEDIMLKHLPRIVKLACQMAEKGDLQAMKMIMDRMVPVQKPVDGNSVSAGNKQINIIINSSTGNSGSVPNVVVQEREPIDGSFEEVSV